MTFNSAQQEWLKRHNIAYNAETTTFTRTIHVVCESGFSYDTTEKVARVNETNTLPEHTHYGEWVYTETVLCPQFGTKPRRKYFQNERSALNFLKTL